MFLLPRQLVQCIPVLWEHPAGLHSTNLIVSVGGVFMSR